MPIFLFALIGLCAWGVGRASASSHPVASPPPQLTAPVVASGRGGWSHHVMPQHYGHAAHYPQHHEYRGGAHLALPPGTPRPMLVFRDYLNAGQRPPPNVVLCAIAEAEVEGDYDLRDQIYRAFVNPNGVPAGGGVSSPAPAADAGDPDAGVREALAATGMEPEAVEREMERIKRERGEAASAPAQPASDGAAAPAASDSNGAGSPADVISGMELGAMDLGHAGPGRRLASPIVGVDGTRWGAFVDRVEREAATFANDKHVGRFRQRRERIRSLGLDPNVVAGSSDAQLDALEKEMAYALHHLRESGMDAHVGETFLIPAPPGDDAPPRKVVATLSGLLGLVQAAGLEGACEWLERPRDRQRFPHTTAAFCRTNNVF